MKNFVLIVLILFLSISCKKELVKQPEKLIDKSKMIDIMYDLSLLEAMRYQKPLSLDSVENDPTKFILKKYKVDSLQFAQNNIYYASDYETYKDMFDEVNKRIAVNQRAADSLAKIDEKKAAKANKEKLKKLKQESKDSVKKTTPKINIDSIKRIQMQHRRQNAKQIK
ncbi:DUF4296 domain-containing protein [Flavobacterium quisquiliarum]|jgi:hypothetical protein|uniref:DUF4296 domain-containing protein n=1 Tax=Flavobacterium quisquiliarum TaxID=1834436 RepID=A0ABV8WAI7_9FLAO|nr:DUF4296 domain-containing protein [Flavobacterium quisquiliarum]MBW1658110.1 DUF4296 domain-containing protein [Flavobacterium quisquiliarum]NWK99881.1 DUF4296 domain-containing protein [Flavobacterium collinsii]